MSTALTLPHRACLTVGGDGATEFLQNLITCDVEGLAEGETTAGALLTPQGKVLFDFLIVRRGGAFLMDVAADRRDELLRRLAFYRLRAPVTLEAQDCAVGFDPSGVEGVSDPRRAALGSRVWGAAGPDGTGAWHAHRIACGVPECGSDFAPDSTFAHEAMLDQFERGGVDFAKGCYVGQEVVSRMKHRGTARSRFVPIEGDGLPPMGCELALDGRRIGTMGSSVNGAGLALVRIDKVAPGDRVTFEGGVATLHPSPFDGFEWPGAAERASQ